ncbi:MAG: hypothetical protein ACOX2N_06540 [Peptococcia bacterium]|jgi:hypothetical protein
MRKQWLKSLTPQKAWDFFYGDEVERFISDFYADGYTDITKMCQRFSQDFPSTELGFFEQGELDYLAALIEQYIREYIEKIGGAYYLKIYSEEELDEMWLNETNELLELIRSAEYSLKHNPTLRLIRTP